MEFIRHHKPLMRNTRMVGTFNNRNNFVGFHQYGYE